MSGGGRSTRGGRGGGPRKNGRERLIDARTGAVVAARIRRAETFLTRLVGLLGRSRLKRGEALWIRPCRGIHTLGMRFPIDALFLDDRLRVVATRQRLAPWRMTGFVRNASSVLELPAGLLRRRGVSVGTRLRLAGGAAASRRPATKRKGGRR